MAIAKWIQFGATPSAAASQAAKPQAVHIGSADGKQFGLENFGNTCYANSVLQALYFCSPFRDLVIQHQDSSVPETLNAHPTPAIPLQPVRRKPERKYSTSGPIVDPNPANSSSTPTGPLIPPSPPTLFSALRSLYLHISKNTADKGTVAPRAFIDKLKGGNELFRSTMHQDAHEFFNYLLNKIVEEIEEERQHQRSDTCTPNGDDLSNSVETLSSKAPPTIVTASTSSNAGSPRDVTLVHKLFEGTLTSETRCLTCETVSSRDESFIDLSIDIEQNSSVTACLRQFSASEMLCQKNKFFCDSCCDLQEAEKRMKIKKLPNVLALHLKRFKYQEDVQKYIKLAYRVAFPFELRLFNTVDDAQDPDRLYELFAIVVHIGNGPHHGHYVSIIKTLGLWLLFDDDTVEPIKESEIPKYFGESSAGSAYVLYYQAVDIDLPTLGLRTPASEPAESLLPSSQPPPDSPTFSQAVVPTQPPGLEEADSSSVSEPSVPSTPASPSSPAIVLVDKPPRKVTSQPLIISVSHEETASTQGNSHRPSPSSTSPGGLSNGTSSKGLFHSLRHAPSTMIGRAWEPEAQPSGSGRPTISTSLGGSLSIAPNTLPPHSVVCNGKEKEKEKEPVRKASTWFKRRSRVEKTQAETIHGDEGGLIASSSSATLRHREVARTSQEPPPLFSMPFVGEPPLMQRSHSVTTPDSPGRYNRSASPPSPPRRSPSTGPLIPSSPQNLLKQSTLPPTPVSPPASRLQAPPDHKKSHPQLRSPRKDRNPIIPPQIPPRPSTATGVSKPISTGKSVPPVPPIPATPFSLAHRRQLSNGQMVHDDVQAKASGGAMRPQSAHANVGLGLMAGGNNSSSTTSSTSGGSSNLMRATRKLSLTAVSPMLGFGRKDKEKERDKDKGKEKRGKERQMPPGAFSSFSMGS